ncbi:MAG TPA: ABC transporter permease [Kofleriaceae bacterium]|nr:ABC transporter permease [Kofleriaceae bacterium]
MLRIVLGRVAGSVVVLLVVASLAFLLLHAAPGGPFDSERRLPPATQHAIEERYHLNEPLWKQYGSYMDGLVHLDFGHSMKRPMTVGELIRGQAPYSAWLGLSAILFATLLGAGLGVLAAVRRNSWSDHGLMAVALVGISVPNLVLGPVLIRYLSLRLGWLPPARIAGWTSYVLPVVTLGLIYAGTVARLARAGMIETLGQDYTRTARAKGVSEHGVVWKHALRLGVVPVITYLGPAMAALITGSFVVETIFQIPGLGFYFIDSVTSRDYPVLTGLLVFYVALTVLMNLLVDLGQALLDPRVREAR